MRLIVDGQIKEQKKMKWNGETLEDDDLLFGYNEEKPIIVNADGHHIRVRYYNSMDTKWGYHDVGYASVNLFLNKDEKGVYTLYVPNVLVEGNFAKVFKVTQEELEGYGFNAKYHEIKDFNPNPKNLEPYYEYIFEVTNQELPPEKPPEEPPHNPPEEPPHNPPEEPPHNPPEVPPEIPPEVPPETPPVTPPQVPPVTPPRRPGAPKTDVASVGIYMVMALCSTLGLAYTKKRKTN